MAINAGITWFDNGTIAETVVDNGDGTATQTTFDRDGNMVSQVQRDDLVSPEPDQLTEIAELRARVDQLLEILEG